MLLFLGLSFFFGFCLIIFFCFFDNPFILCFLKKINPTIGKILISSTDPEALETSVKALGAICIPKPVKIDDLLVAIEKVAV